MNTHKKNIRKRLYIQALFFCSLLPIFSCTKEKKESERSYPLVVTGMVTNINADGATFNGSFLQAGNSEIIDHGFVFNTNSSPDIRSGNKISLGSSSGKGSFTATANVGMEAGETYYVSAYAQNKDHIYYAESVKFVSMGSISPEILKIVPAEGLRGDTVVIKGKYFSQSSFKNTVKFNDSQAFIIAASDSTLTVSVPASNGMEFVDVFVTVAERTAQKMNGFHYLKPEIMDFSPKQGVIGDTITVTGKNLRLDMEIKFNQTKARIHKSDYTSARVIVPACQSASTNISVTIDGLTGIAEQMFTYAQPEITWLASDLMEKKKYSSRAYVIIKDYTIYGNQISFTALGCKDPEIHDFYPKSGFYKDIITLKGNFFSHNPQNNIVKINSLQAEVLVSTVDSLTFRIPPSSFIGKAYIYLTVGEKRITSASKLTILGPVIESVSSNSGY